MREGNEPTVKWILEMQEKASQEEKSQWKHNGEERGGQNGTLAASLNLIPMLLWEAHSVSHESKDSMMKLLKRLWWWPNQRYTVEDFEEKTSMPVRDYSDMGPEQRTSDYWYLFIMVDKFTGNNAQVWHCVKGQSKEPPKHSRMPRHESSPQERPIRVIQCQLLY